MQKKPDGFDVVSISTAIGIDKRARSVYNRRYEKAQCE